MFQVGFLEILLILVLSLFIFGPQKLPSAIKSFTRFWYLTKSKIESARSEFERNIGAEEIEQDVFNELKLKEFDKNEH
ncbi:MAG: Sec-independent protein translocase protein TatB [Gammaproteobacteria bacterium]